MPVQPANEQPLPKHARESELQERRKRPCCHGNGAKNEKEEVMVVVSEKGVAMDTGDEGDREEKGLRSSPSTGLFRDAHRRGADDESMQWEEFFGPTVDLVPTLLDIYDALIADRVPSERCRSNNNYNSKVSDNVANNRTTIRPINRSRNNQSGRGGLGLGLEMPNAASDLTEVPTRRKCCDYNRRPLSVSSASSAFSSSSSASSSSSSLSSSCTNTSSLSRSHGSNKKSYLASIESLEDGGDGDDDDDEDDDIDDEDDDIDEDEEEDEGCVTNESRVNRCVVSKESSSTSAKSSAGASTVQTGSGSNNCSVISAPTPPQLVLRPRYCDPNLSHTDRVVLEILDTERTYVRDLHEIIQGYLGHLKDGFPEIHISAENVDNLFGNVEEIYRFNREFLNELEACATNPVLVAQAFVRHTKGFAIYTEYCTNYPRTVSVLTDLMRRGKTAEVFKVHQAALGHMLPLGSYLLKPVQRILKYHLLLQNMAKHYVKDVDGYEDVVAALATMTGIACHINDMKRRHEHAVRVQEIQSLLYGWEGQDLTTYGELIAEGTFRVYGAKAVRHVFLFDTMLLLTKKKEDSSLSYKTHIMCSNLMLIESIPGEPLCFHVIPFDNPRVQHTLQARNLEQKREWALQLKRVILENYNVDIPSHARELVMQLGQNRPEDEILVERGNCSSRRNHSAPEYLERRYKHEKERRRMDNINRALRIRRGSKKCGAETPSPLMSPSGEESKVGELHNRSSSCDRNSSCSSKEMMQRNLSASSLPGQKSKTSRGWRRKSEPCELLSSQESLTSPSSNVQQKSMSIFHASHSPSVREDDDCEDAASAAYNKEAATTAASSDEYVTFFFSGGRKQSCPVTSDAHIYEVPCARHSAGLRASSQPQSSGYDNLENLWETQNNGGGGGVTVQRTDSMNSNSDYGSMTTTTTTPRRPDMLNVSMNLPQDLLDSTSSPTTPAVWLKQQQDHMAEASLKAGSLPRSFQLKPEDGGAAGGTDQAAADGVGAFKLRRSVDRPFTIASDKPCQSDLNLDDFERYIEDSPTKQRSYRFPAAVAADQDQEDEDHEEEEEDMMMSSTSIVQEQVHPENRIYRPSISRSSLRSLLANVGSKLVHLRMQSSTSKEPSSPSSVADHQSCTSLNTDTSTAADASAAAVPLRRSKSAERDRLTNKLIVSVTHIYSRMIRQRGSSLQNGGGCGADTNTIKRRVSSPGGLLSGSLSSLGAGGGAPTIHKQGSPAIGARMARQMDRHIQLLTCGKQRTSIDSCISMSTCDVQNLSLEAECEDDDDDVIDGAEAAGIVEEVLNTVAEKVDDDVRDEMEVRSDVSGDSFYERSFEAMESVLSQETSCRDSVILFSRNDDDNLPETESSSSTAVGGGLRLSASNPEKVSSSETAEPVVSGAGGGGKSASGRGQGIMETLRHLEQCSTYTRDQSDQQRSTTANSTPLKSIRERCRDLELWRTKVDGDTDSTGTAGTPVKSFQSLPSSPEKCALSKGWVKRVVDRLESDT